MMPVGIYTQAMSVNAEAKDRDAALRFPGDRQRRRLKAHLCARSVSPGQLCHNCRQTIPRTPGGSHRDRQMDMRRR